MINPLTTNIKNYNRKDLIKIRTKIVYFLKSKIYSHKMNDI